MESVQFKIQTVIFRFFPKIGVCARRGVAVLFLAVFLFMLSPGVRAELVDHIVAAVNNEVITATELAQAVAWNERLGKPGRDRKTLESETLEGLITRRLLVQEARRLNFVDVSDQEVSAEVETLMKRVDSEAAFTDFLNSLDMTQQELARMLGEQLLVKKFVEKKVGLFVRVTRDEAERYYTAHAAQFQGKSFQEAQKGIVDILMDEKVGQQLDRYVAELHSKADIRINP